jgi:magnesium chelatase family protein
MLARRLSTILPGMTLTEALDTTNLPRSAGLTDDRTEFGATRPCRASHHRIAAVGMIGGDEGPLPGDVSSAHHGARLLDARPTCRRHIIEVLHQPLKKGVIYRQSREHY